MCDVCSSNYYDDVAHATTARVSYFHDKRDLPVISKQQVHLIYEALHSLDSSPLRGHFFSNSLYHALPPEAKEYLATADTPQARLSYTQANDRLRSTFQPPCPSAATIPSSHQSPTLTSTSYAAVVKPPTATPPTSPPTLRIQELLVYRPSLSGLP